jgi:hypothetical protein
MHDATDELDLVRDAVLDLPGVVGVGHQNHAIVVLTRNPAPEAIARVDTMTTVPVTEEVIGEPEAAVGELRTSGPLERGCNIAFPAHDGQDAYVVSAYHCVYDTAVGETIRVGDRAIGEVTHHTELTTPDGPAALAIDGDWFVARATNAQPIRDIERVADPLAGDYYDPAIGDTLVKEGDRTGVSRGAVFAKDVSVVSPADVSGFGVRTRVDHLTGVNTTVSPGDSGGAVMYEMDDHYRPVGTVYGGTPSSTMFYTDMGHVKARTGLQFAGAIPPVADGGDGTIIGGDPDPPPGAIGPSRADLYAGIGILAGTGLLLAALRDRYDRQDFRPPIGRR